jgi:hypothetical protein
VKADICARPDGVHKAALMRTLYRSNPSFLPLFSLLTQWARGLGIIRSASQSADSGRCTGDCKDTVLTKSGFFHAVIIHILLIIESEEDERERRNARRSGRIVALMDEVNDWNGIDDDKDADADTIGAEEGGGGEWEGEAYTPAIMLQSLSNAFAHHTNNDVNSPYDVPDFDYLAHASQCSPEHLARLMTAFFRAGSQLKDEVCFVWPVPGRPEHTLDLATVADFAEHCSRSYQTLAYSGSWTSILDQSGYLDDFPFTLELPESITEMLSRNAFMALKLQTLSKVYSVFVCVCACSLLLHCTVSLLFPCIFLSPHHRPFLLLLPIPFRPTNLHIHSSIPFTHGRRVVSL